ncbi:MAG: DUF4143 domain-containing protein [Parachlamydiales bacterium]|jgi:hypothetical protein
MFSPELLKARPEVYLRWLRGSLIASYRTDSAEESLAFRESYLRSFGEKELPSLGLKENFAQTDNLCRELARWHGKIVNASQIARNLKMADWKVRRYLDFLPRTLLVRRLEPWQEALSKRQVKSPKLYFRDSGLVNLLLGLKTEDALLFHPQKELLWQGFALEEVLKSWQAGEKGGYFWQTQAGAELPLFLLQENRRLGFEFQSAGASKVTLSMKIALKDLKLDHLYLIVPGSFTFSLAEKITVRGIETLESFIDLKTHGQITFPDIK